MRCGDLLHFAKTVPSEFLWTLFLSAKHELHEWSRQRENSYEVYAFFPPIFNICQSIITSGTNPGARVLEKILSQELVGNFPLASLFHLIRKGKLGSAQSKTFY